MTASDLAALKSTATDAITKFVSDAFEAGREAGRREMARQFHMLTAPFLPDAEAVPATTEKDSGHADLSPQEATLGQRRPRGTVKPEVWQYLSLGRTGRPADIAKAIDQNENSVRGVLNVLRGEGFAVKYGNRWAAHPNMKGLPLKSQ